jgi:hypothetical protein
VAFITDTHGKKRPDRRRDRHSSYQAASQALFRACAPDGCLKQVNLAMRIE